MRRCKLLTTWKISLAILGVMSVAPAIAKPEAAPQPPALAHQSSDTLKVAAWIKSSGDNLGLPFLIIDKINARVFAYSADGALRQSAPVLLGIAKSDVTPPGISGRKLAGVLTTEKITPAGRFLSSIGNDLGPKNILWIDYEAGISLHRVVKGTPRDKRLARLASPQVNDNRITYGCVNVPSAFFDDVIEPLLQGRNAMVYILPEARSVAEVFNIKP
jgi:hypothetical protein